MQLHFKLLSHYANTYLFLYDTKNQIKYNIIIIDKSVYVTIDYN